MRQKVYHYDFLHFLSNCFEFKSEIFTDVFSHTKRTQKFYQSIISLPGFEVIGIFIIIMLFSNFNVLKNVQLSHSKITSFKLG